MTSTLTTWLCQYLPIYIRLKQPLLHVVLLDEARMINEDNIRIASLHTPGWWCTELPVTQIIIISTNKYHFWCTETASPCTFDSPCYESRWLEFISTMTWVIPVKVDTADEEAIVCEKSLSSHDKGLWNTTYAQRNTTLRNWYDF